MYLFTIRKEYIQQLITTVLFSTKKLYANFYMSTKAGELPLQPMDGFGNLILEEGCKLVIFTVIRLVC